MINVNYVLLLLLSVLIVGMKALIIKVILDKFYLVLNVYVMMDIIMMLIVIQYVNLVAIHV